MAKIDLRENEFLGRFVGPDHINSNDVQFWYQLLSCSFNFMRVQDPKVVDRTLSPFIDLLALNNSQSLNFGSLVRVALDRVSRVKSKSGQSINPYYTYQSFNALYLIRSICKNYIENTSEEKLVQSFRARVELAPQAPQRPNQPVLPPQHLQQQQQVVQQTIPNSAPNQSQQPPPVNLTDNPSNQVDSQDIIEQGQEAHTKQNDTTASIPTPTTDNGSLEQNQQQQMQTSAINPTTEPSKKVEVTPGAVMLDQFISTLIAIIVDIPPSDMSYHLQVEAINSLIVLLSVQMYSGTHASQSIIFKSLMEKRCSIHALVLTKTLLKNFIRQDPVPQETGSIIIGLASGLWKVLTLGYGVQEDEASETMPYLAGQSLLLLNILTNHYASGKNPYREAIISCQDTHFDLSDPQNAFENANNDILATAATSQAILVSNSIKVEFSQLYDSICKHLENDQVALLLYLLLQGNKIFKPYILTTASNRLDQLLLPLLRVLYASIRRGSHHVYMVVIIFLILSEEAAFNEAMHKIILKNIPWFKDRMLSEISLGSFTPLVMIRSFQYNTFREKDKYLHTNLYAILANLSCYFYKLHPYVCQRLVEFLERLTKRYLTITKADKTRTIDIKEHHQLNQSALGLLNSNNPLAKALATDTCKQDLQDVSSIELDSTPGGNSNGVAVNISIPEQPAPNVTNSSGSSIILPPVDMHGNEYDVGGNQDNGQLSPNSNNSGSDHINISVDGGKPDAGFLEDVIRKILDIINHTLATQLTENPELIYTLLYKRDVFSSLLASKQSFYNAVIDIERILTFFYNKIEAHQRQLSVEEIMELIVSTSREWHFDQSKDSGTKQLFSYVECDGPEDFFIPYMWTRIYYSSGIVWNPKRIVLFDPEIL